MASNKNKWIKDSYINANREWYFFPSIRYQEEKIQKVYKMIYGDIDFLDYIEDRNKLCTRKGDLENFKYWTLAHSFHDQTNEAHEAHEAHQKKTIGIHDLCCPFCRLDTNANVSSSELESAIRKSYMSTINIINRNYIFDIHTIGMSLQTILNNAL